MSSWLGVERELEFWRGSGLTARFWVRDDDACHVTPQLERLASLAARHRIEIGLGVIPGKLGGDLVQHLNTGPTPFHPMCHGWMHVNYGVAGKPAEFGPERPASTQIEDLKLAHKAFRSAFDVAAVFVPPFNRIDAAIAKELPALGFAALSSSPGVGLQRLARVAGRTELLPPLPVQSRIAVRPFDVQIDPVDWARGTARDARGVIETLLGELRIRRKGYIDPAVPIGILLHHLIHDDAIWALSDEMLTVLRASSAAAFPRLGDIMPGHGTSTLQSAGGSSNMAAA